MYKAYGWNTAFSWEALVKISGATCADEKVCKMMQPAGRLSPKLHVYCINFDWEDKGKHVETFYRRHRREKKRCLLICVFAFLQFLAWYIFFILVCMLILL